MVDILLYSGSYNPIHKGHTAIAKYLLEGGFCKQLWLVVSPHNPLKAKDGLISAEHRLCMARLATRGFTSGLVVSDVELSMPQPSYTIDTLERLMSEFKGKKFGLLIGSDNIDDLAKWKDIQRLRSLCTLFIYPRAESENAEGLDGDFVFLKDAPLINVSSTQIREQVASSAQNLDYLDPQVLSYIKQNHLWEKI